MLHNGLVKCLHTSCFNFFGSKSGLNAHLKIRGGDHQCADRLACPGCQRSDAVMTMSTTLPDPKEQSSGTANPKLLCKHDGCTLEYRRFTDLHIHCRSIHQCGWTYATCPNDRFHRKRVYTVSPDDTASIEMMLADGLFKCLHTSCLYFMPTEDANHAHQAHVDHHCTDYKTCIGCLNRANTVRSRKRSLDYTEVDDTDDDKEVDGDDDNAVGTISESTPKLQCLHDDCTAMHNRMINLRNHCASSHECTHTYASCPNERKNRIDFFDTPPEDVESITMMKADGMIKCWHTSCNKWFRHRHAVI
ncbi:hypothetical protein SAMD00019534_092550 [Acytostelium subglobosum LB1]|uniref:hypothetical protein n=1 Tax=Acytostelium subglobosum LB1 TaxID=1410327 RepID=UPI00064513F3|nr:hypothetical protein SAMD00019534_092550 [Acytostelium subglobosum LB1]GAM26080.1 hypothetical protein SAMD00019534_092550 [Acytostelium subglobosum LB1]|eukprot:XP_012751123.1 hypothetical protein SAMD00019534_092550 [Acytostelium subglobosum LB1]